MATNTSELQQVFRRVRPLPALAVLLALLLGVYYLFLGVRFWNAFQDAGSLTREFEQHSGAGLELPDSTDLETRRAEAGQRLEDQRVWYSYTDDADLLGLIAESAGDSRVDLLSVNIGESVTRAVGTLALTGVNLNISVRGNQPEDIYGFVSRISTATPVNSVVDLQLNGLEGNTSADVRVLFFLLPPEPVSGGLE